MFITTILIGTWSDEHIYNSDIPCINPRLNGFHKVIVFPLGPGRVGLDENIPSLENNTKV